MASNTVTITGTLQADPHLDQGAGGLPVLPLVLREIDFDPDETLVHVSSFDQDAQQDSRILREGDTVVVEAILLIHAIDGHPRRRRRSRLRQAIMRRLLAR